MKNAGALLKWIYRFGNVILRNPSALTGKFRYLFVLSHMRGYTTLVSHILGSHPQISGYFELHQSYRTAFDLFLMRVRVANGLNYQVHGTYLLDKILHSRLHISPDILQREDVFTIFTIRKPEESIRSLMNMTMQKSLMDARKKPGTLDYAMAHYVDRLNSLKNMSHIPRNRIYVDGESLVENPEPVLEFIRSFLHLDEKISASYSTFKLTGTDAGAGDFLGYIKQGKIVKQRDAHNEYQITPDALEKACEVYEETRSVLKKNCPNI